MQVFQVPETEHTTRKLQRPLVPMLNLEADGVGGRAWGVQEENNSACACRHGAGGCWCVCAKGARKVQNTDTETEGEGEDEHG